MAIVVAFDRQQASEIFRLVTKRPPEHVHVEHVEQVTPLVPKFRDDGPFQRLDLRSIQFPVPGLWISAADCGRQHGLRRMGFERFSERDPVQPLPQAPAITVTFPNRHDITLWMRDPRNPLRAVKQPLFEAEFEDSHPKFWLDGVFSTGHLALITTLAPFSSYDTIGAAILASWVLLVPVPQYGHSVPQAPVPNTPPTLAAEPETGRWTDRPRPPDSKPVMNDQMRDLSRQVGVALSDLVSERASGQGSSEGLIARAPYLVDLPKERVITPCLLGGEEMPGLLVQLSSNASGLLTELEAAGLRRIRGFDRTLPTAPQGWGFVLWPHQVLIVAGPRPGGGFVKLLFDPLMSSDDWLRHVNASGFTGFALLVTSGVAAGRIDFAGQLKKQMEQGLVVGGALIGWLADKRL